MRRATVTSVSLFLLVFLLSISATAQETPDYFPSVPQGGPNLGNVQPYSALDVQRNTGVVAWHNAGHFGAGVRIGVLDQGFAGLTDLIARSTARIQVEPGRTPEDYAASTERHGTDVAEVILMAAPRADLFVCEYNDFNRFVRCINWLLASDVQIVTHSVGVPALPLDGSNPWAREVDRAQRDGVLWINAAGNFNQGFISQIFTDTNLNTYHEFRGRGIVEALAVTASQTARVSRIMLSWEGRDQVPANAIDLDLEVVDTVGRVIATSTQPQTGSSTDTALEIVQVPTREQIGIRVRDAEGSGELVQFALFIEFAVLDEVEAGGSIIAPADSLSALTVGALQGNQIAPYSSRGPLVSGALKPDLVAPGEIILSDGRDFVGTSAAAPLVAGIAALALEQYPEWQQPQVRRFLIDETRDDSGIPGPDNVYGNGLLYVASPELVASRIQERAEAIRAAPTLRDDLPVGLVTSNAAWQVETRLVDGVEMVFVPPGCFIMGSTLGRPNELPPHPQCFDRPFLIDRYEVTNAQYGAAWPESWTDPDRPRIVVNYDDASAHCQRRGARLPTEAEWEYAARGPDGLDYPWGASFVVDGGIFGLNSEAQTAPVGSVPGGVAWVGTFDMSGNVYEWTSSYALPYPYDSSHEVPNATTEQRVLRGGSWITNEDALRTSFRVFVDTDFEYNTVGFRCAMTLEGFDPIPIPSNILRAASAAADENVIYANFLTGANLRAGPGIEFDPPIGSANEEMRLPVVAQTQVNGETWYLVVDFDGIEKWAFGSLVQLDPPDAVPPVR
jgi:formylglycine-generating enzyme required for sulfatase activity